jgi:hypothetical protein
MHSIVSQDCVDEVWVTRTARAGLQDAALGGQIRYALSLHLDLWVSGMSRDFFRVESGEQERDHFYDYIKAIITHNLVQFTIYSSNDISQLTRYIHHHHVY